jgi:ABC-type polysaccharide/polyol phosphate transport system ATPase subunit
MADAPSIVVDNVSKRFRIYHEKNLTLKSALLRRRRGRFESFWALRDVSFEVRPGAALGIIGSNGSGKSTLLKLIAGILRPESGTIHTEGRLAALLELGAGFFYEYSGRENIYLSAAILGLPRAYIDEVIGEIIEFAGLERFIDNAVKTYSSGMFARLGFSIAVYLDPDIVLIDEILSVGDEAFARKSYDRIAEMKSRGKTMVMVSHALESIQELCTDCLWLDNGDIKAHGSADSVIDQYVNQVNRAEAAERTHGAARELRPGDPGAIAVKTVTVYGAKGPAAVVETGDPIEIHVEYEAAEPVEGMRFTIDLWREDGVLALSTATTADDADTIVMPATGSVVLSIPELPLMEGLFRISVRVTDVESEVMYVQLDKAFPFKVVSYRRNDGGVALLGHQWKLPVQSRKDKPADSLSPSA